MIRVLIYLFIVCVVAVGAVWFAERPGEVAITWQGCRVETSVMVALVAVVAIAVAVTLLWSLLRAALRWPEMLARKRQTRRGVRGYQAVSQGLIAVASGDMRAAKRFADEARRLAPSEPLTLLLGAQTAQLAGDRALGRARLPRDGGARRHQAARPARPLYRGAAARRPGGRARLRRGSRQARGAAGLGRPGGARVPLRHRRLERRARPARAQHEAAAWSTRPAIGASAPCCSPRRRSPPPSTERDPRARARARGRQARAHPGAGGRARRLAARRGRRAAQGRAHHRGGLEGQPASRSGRGLRASAPRRLRARAAHPHRGAGEARARQCRGGAGGGARRDRRAGIRRRARGARHRSRSRRASASRC